jgi:SET and MYND domain-containing protein
VTAKGFFQGSYELFLSFAFIFLCWSSSSTAFERAFSLSSCFSIAKLIIITRSMEHHCFISPKVLLDDSEPGNRKVMCSKEIKAGELLIEENFQLTAIYSQNISHACHFCLAEGPEMKRCSNCKYSHYCSSDHQTLDWKRGHKKECAILKQMTQDGKRQPTALLALTLKAFVQLELLNNQSLKKNLESLKHHPDTMTPEKHAELEPNIILVVKYSDNNFDRERLERFIDYQDKMLVNGMTVYSKTDPRNSLAMGLLNDCCRFNHSCAPNSFPVYNPQKGNRLVSARLIKPGEEITCSYLNTLARVADRKKKLKEEYCFDCSCSKCKRDEELAKTLPPPKYSVDQLRKQLDSFEEVKAFISQMEKDLPEFDYDWNEVLETAEPVLIKLNELEFLYKFRKRFTKKFEKWFGDSMMNPGGRPPLQPPGSVGQLSRQSRENLHLQHRSPQSLPPILRRQRSRRPGSHAGGRQNLPRVPAEEVAKITYFTT